MIDLNNKKDELNINESENKKEESEDKKDIIKNDDIEFNEVNEEINTKINETSFK